MKNKLFLIFGFGVMALFSLHAQTRKEVTVNTVRNTTQVNGFSVLAPTYDLVNIDGRNNVIKINAAASQWNVMEYSLANYRNRPITIHISADVMRTGPKKGFSWQVNNDPDYPTFAIVSDPKPGVWQYMSGTLTIIPTNSNPALQLSKWEQHSAKNTFFYIDNISITVETWDYTPAATLAAAGQANSNGTRNFYVSTGRGSDNGNGTQEKPFAKIAHAMYYVRPGDTALVDSGAYHENFLIPSGTTGKPVTLSAMPGANVTITPTIKITPQWRRHNGNIYAADISEYAQYINNEFPQLFADNDSMVEARYPNMGASMKEIWDYKRDVAQKGTNKNTIVANGNIPANIAGARLVIWPGSSEGPGWTSFVSHVMSVNGKKINLTQEITADAGHNPGDPYTPYPGNPFYITGALALLDAPGEYYFDRQTSLLYFYPPWNGAPDTRTLVMRGKNDIAILAADTSNIIIKDITVFGGGINMRNCRNNILENCRVLYAQHFYANFWAAQMEDSRWNNSMVVTGSNNRITRCEFGLTAGNGIILGGDDNVFTNNYVHDADYAGNEFASVYVRPQTARLEVSHNTMINSGRAHVFFEGLGEYESVGINNNNRNRVFERCIIRNNYFENNNIFVPDGGGGFYTWGTNGGGTEIYNNFVVVDGSKGDNGTMHRLLVGLYIDDLSFNYIVHHNIVIGGTDVGIRHGLSHVNIAQQQGMRIFNNTIIGSQSGFGFHYVMGQNADTRNVTITGNLLVNIKARDIEGSGLENGKWANYNGDFINGTIPVTKNPQRRMTSSGNARGAIDAQFRPTGNTPDIGAVQKGGEIFKFGADWGPNVSSQAFKAAQAAGGSAITESGL